MDSKFYGYYSSFDQTKNFTTVEQGDLMFPPTVIYNNVTYRFMRAYQVDTPSQHTAFEKFCMAQGCELDIAL